MYLFLFGCIGLAIIAYIVSILVNRDIPEKTKKEYVYARRENLLTPRETECYKRLVNLVGAQYFIFAQVHLSSILDERQFKGQSWKGARARVSQKSVDFLLCDKERISPVLAIELDDSSHSRLDRINRDQLVNRILHDAGVPLLRIQSTSELESRLLAVLNQPTAPQSG